MTSSGFALVGVAAVSATWELALVGVPSGWSVWLALVPFIIFPAIAATFIDEAWKGPNRRLMIAVATAGMASLGGAVSIFLGRPPDDSDRYINSAASLLLGGVGGGSLAYAIVAAVDRFRSPIE